MALPRKYRFRVNRKNLPLLKRGNVLKTAYFVVYYLKNKNQESRFAVLVGGSISKKAVIRNHLRRLIEGVILKNLPKGLKIDMIIYPRKAILNIDKKEIENEVGLILVKL